VNRLQRAIADKDHRDRGAYAVLYAVLITVIVGIAALVLDLATLRLDRRTNRAAADSAAIAAAAELGQAGSNPRDACLKAMSYAGANLGIATVDNTCGAFPVADTDVEARCAADTKQVANYPANGLPDPDGIRIEVSWPVPNDDPLMTDPDRENTTTIVQDVSNRDGQPCQRMAVEIIQRGDFAFAGIFGFSGQTTRSHSVGLATFEGGDAPAALVVLDEDACQALTMEGGGSGDGVIVEADPSGKFGGTIAVDSSGEECKQDVPSDKVIAGTNNNNLWALDSTAGVRAQIKVFARAFVPSPPGKAYNSADVDGCLGGSSDIDQMRAWNANVCPEPTPRSARVTDAPWVNRYNCPTTPVECGHADDFPESLTAYNFVRQWTEWAADVAPGIPESAVKSDALYENLYADCDSLEVESDAVLTVTDKLVVRGDLYVQKGCLLIDAATATCTGGTPPAATDDGSVYVGGSFTVKPGAKILIDRAFVYVGGSVEVGSNANGINGEAGAVTWIAPFGSQADCTITNFPSPACFEALALWADGGGGSLIKGGASLVVDGSFFLPNATFEFGGGSQDHPTRAQFVSRLLRFHGSSSLRMVPDVDWLPPIPNVGSELIR
jgi:hypothetical protein